MCTANLITYYFGNYNLIFLQFLILGLAILYGSMLLQYVFYSLEIKLPKYWSFNYWFFLLVFISSFYYLFLPDETQKRYFDEMIQGNHMPIVILGNLVLLHSVVYFIYLRIFLNKFKVKSKDIHLEMKKEWVSDFVNYMIFCNIIFILYYVIVSMFYAQYIVFGDLVIVPILILAIYSFIVVKSSQKHKEAELKYVLSQVENQNKLLQQRLSISRDLHDNIGSQLTFIISSIDNLKLTYKVEDKYLNYKLLTIGDFAKNTIVELRDTVWALNSVEMLFEDLEIRINNFIDKARISNQNICFSFLIHEDLRSVKLTAVEGMNIYRTIQEAVNNAFKHAKASRIAIQVEKIESIKRIIISDNGIGFNEEVVQDGNGLKNMRKRIEQIGGIFTLISNSEGTKIEIYI